MGVRLRADNWHTYDTADRLITTRYKDPQDWSVVLENTSWYQYDDLGNRMSHKYRTDSAIAYAHDKANRMTTLAAVTQGYDDAGNLTLAYSADRGTSYTYRYDHHNRLTGVYDSTNTTRKAAFTWDGLGRRIEHVSDVLGTTSRYYYDGVNELVEFDGAGSRERYYVHGVSYIDERLMMYDDDSASPYYFVVDRMYNARSIIDRAGAIVERYAYDSYGRPRIRESCGRGDMNQDSIMNSTDTTRFDAAKAGSIWDPRADLDDDGDVDADDETLYDAKLPDWDSGSTPTVAQAFSDVGNWYMFQGVPHLALDTAADATEDKLSLNHHRARYEQCPEGRWTTRDPLYYLKSLLMIPIPFESIFRGDFNSDQKENTPLFSQIIAETFGRDGADLNTYLNSAPITFSDASGLACGGWGAGGAPGWGLQFGTPIGNGAVSCTWLYCITYTRTCTNWVKSQSCCKHDGLS